MLGRFSILEAEATDGDYVTTPPSKIFISWKLVVYQPPGDERSRWRNVRVPQQIGP